jgi:hypothetical protein
VIEKEVAIEFAVCDDDPIAVRTVGERWANTALPADGSLPLRRRSPLLSAETLYGQWLWAAGIRRYDM